MQGGDIAGSWSDRNVVVLTPLLMVPPAHKRSISWRLIADRKRVMEARAEQYTLNMEMARWMVAFARQYSMPWVVWSFDPPELMNLLVKPVQELVGEYIAEWRQWPDVKDASAYLRMNLDSIHHVYDADIDRHELWWQMHGVHIPPGKMPEGL